MIVKKSNNHSRIIFYIISSLVIVYILALSVLVIFHYRNNAKEDIVLFDYLKFIKGGIPEATIDKLIPAKYKYEEINYEKGKEYSGNIWYRFNNNKITKVERYSQEKGFTWSCSITIYYDYNNKVCGFNYSSGDTFPQVTREDKIIILKHLRESSPDGKYVSPPPYDPDDPSIR